MFYKWIVKMKLQANKQREKLLNEITFIGDSIQDLI